MCNKLYWYGDEEFGWSARGSHGVGGDYWITLDDNTVNSFQIMFQERQSGNTYRFHKTSDTLDGAKVIAQANNNARRMLLLTP
jgi:hypothetical protein